MIELEKLADEIATEFFASKRHFIVVHGGDEEQREQLTNYLQERISNKFVFSNDAKVKGEEYYNVDAGWAFSQAAS